MEITVEVLVACGISATPAKAFAPHIERTCQRFKISTPLQRAGFIAQSMHESARFTQLEEDLWYSNPQNIARAYQRLSRIVPSELVKYCKNPKGLANLAYANQNGNGDEASGDGWKFRGRGLFGLTGRANYAAAAAATGRPYESQPELVSQPEDAALTAGWFWAETGCNAFMASGEFDKTTARINGGQNGAADRRANFGTCRTIIK